MYSTATSSKHNLGITARNRNPLEDGLNPFYPQQPDYSPTCGVNVIYRTLPPYNPPTEHNGGPTYWETTVAGPASIKSLYTGIPNYYPPMLITRPVDTLYGHDYSLFHKGGSGTGKRMGYQAKMFPLTDRNVREYREYSEHIIEPPNFMSRVKHPVVVKDLSLNSPLQVLPQAYRP